MQFASLTARSERAERRFSENARQAGLCACRGAGRYGEHPLLRMTLTRREASCHRSVCQILCHASRPAGTVVPVASAPISPQAVGAEAAIVLMLASSGRESLHPIRSVERVARLAAGTCRRESPTATFFCIHQQLSRRERPGERPCACPVCKCSSTRTHRESSRAEGSASRCPSVLPERVGKGQQGLVYLLLPSKTVGSKTDHAATGRNHKRTLAQHPLKPVCPLR